MPAAMLEADINTNNSISEGFCNALYEASCVGVPILAKNIPGNMVAFESGCQGLLYDSPQKFIEQAVTLTRTPKLRHQLSQPQQAPRSPMEKVQHLETIFSTLAA